MRTILALLFSSAALCGAGMQAGIGRVDITPSGPIWLSGYAARTHPSEGSIGKLWAKALAIESAPGQRIVIVTTDVVGIPGSISNEVAARVEKQFGVKRPQFFINASHTHTGPLIWSNLNNLTVLPPEEQQKLEVYARKFTDDLVAAIGAAVHDLSPAVVEYGAGAADFAINRRNAISPNGPVDHTVPVLKITDGQGRLRAMLFGYACHNTTLTAEVYQVTGDYAGFAAADLEKAHPDATALFLQLCGADQNPSPRGTVELGQKHGATLAAEVERVIAAPMTALAGPIRSAFRTTELKLAPRSREDLEAELKAKLPAAVRRAKMMLKLIDAGKPI